ncbi:hypothetical protein LEM8419_02452 [Neolewinella maritima]|uniref:N-acetyltransferase domain-containing protein n=1 Tax=Neolewinella maritima TaxID=1383882 RepID=A0ABM9B2X7_9BACT|nr:GNAT family N-acetyltransferase [Neolewinella maritima]CAH1001549.1 hypothetical protein LEM8419_02452 [Neolewinella maritima]
MLPNPLPTLQNDLVTLRPLVPADREDLYAVANDKLLWEQHSRKDRYQRPVFDAMFDDAVASGGAFTVLDRRNGDRIIGSTRLKYISPTALEIGWTFLDRRLWGTAYNRAMKSLLIDYVFGRDMDVVFYVNEFNYRSQRAVSKLGATLLTDTDHPLYSRSAEDGLTYLLRRPASSK